MNLLKQRATVEMVVASGSLCVTVRPSPHWFLLLFQAGVIAIFSVFSFRTTLRMSLLERLLTMGLVIGAIAAWFEQLFGLSEVIEFDAKHLRIRKETLGWERTREYLIEKIRDLELQAVSGGLQCRLGWRTIEFGGYLSEEQANEVLIALEHALPEVAQKLFPSVDITTHFT